MTSMDLTPAQEHYLKRELIKLEINDEFERFNDAFILRRFGFPFSPSDPKHFQGHSEATVAIGNELPLSQFFFHQILTELPFLSANHQNAEQFWVNKVQVFYENFMSMNVSETKDREELTKRRKMGNKVNKMFLMIFNSGVGTVNELGYYDDRKEELKNADYQPVESERLRKLLAPSKESVQRQIGRSKFMNGISLNVVGVRLVEKQSSSTRLWNTVTMINQLQKNDNYYEFLIKSKVDLPESEEVIVGRRYGEFKALHARLKKKFPGKKIPSLPSKVKSEINVSGEYDEDDDEDDDEILEEEEKEESLRQRLHEIEKKMELDIPTTPKSQLSERFESAPSSPLQSPIKITPKGPKSPIAPSKIKGIKLPWKTSDKKEQNLKNHIPREKTRLGLRSYLRTLLEDIEISHCEILKEFLFKGRIHKLSESQTQDIAKRESLDLLLVMNQLKFQNETYSKIQELKQSSLELRRVLLEDDDGLIIIFNEIKTKNHIHELSPMLRSFIDWCKIEISATIYQLFLGQDSSYEFFSQVKRIHSLMPYSIMINILRFTNPMSIMKTMIDLLMSNPFGGKSLLQTLFYGVLSDDIKSQNRIILDLEMKITHPSLVERLKWFVFESSEDYDLVENLKVEAKELNFDVLLAILLSPRLNNVNEPSNAVVHELMESYLEYKKLVKVKNEEDSLFINHEKTSLYSNLKQLYKLYIRNHDKEIMQQMWSQPELTLILKELFTMFYQPLVNLFKNSHVDQAFKSFQKFMDDLIQLIDSLSDEIYSIDPNKIVTEIMNVLNRHEDEFYRFLHEVYVNDKDGIFEGLIIWINGILKLLRVAKSSNNYAKVDIVNIIESAKEDLNQEELLDELNTIIEQVKANHELIMSRLAKTRIAKSDLLEGDIEQNWGVINQDMEFFHYEDFGINDYDVNDFQDDDDDEVKMAASSDSHDEPYDKVIKNDEIVKLLGAFKTELTRVLNSY